jgi:glyoxylase-like metal-dependent hydrolase (beta-lactamase superfamily II)
MWVRIRATSCPSATASDGTGATSHASSYPVSQSSCIDLVPLGLEGIIGCYLLDASEPTLVDPGPGSTADRLREALGEHGVGPADLRHIALTHIHLDHAGATGHLTEWFPNATVHIHQVGASHMVDPRELLANTRRAFGPATDDLWGDVKPVPAERIREWNPGGRGPWRELRPIHTPGHISHHVSYLDERDGTLYSGDSMGVALSGSPPHPMGPPPNVDVPDWLATIEEVGMIGPERIAPTHFGFRGDVEAYLAEFGRRLADMAARASSALESGDASQADVFDSEIRAEMTPYMGEERAERYFEMFPPRNDWAGVSYYLERNS